MHIWFHNPTDHFRVNIYLVKFFKIRSSHVVRWIWGIKHSPVSFGSVVLWMHSGIVHCRMFTDRFTFCTFYFYYWTKSSVIIWKHPIKHFKSIMKIVVKSQEMPCFVIIPNSFQVLVTIGNLVTLKNSKKEAQAFVS